MEKFSVLERKLFQSLRAEAGLQSGAEKRRSAEKIKKVKNTFRKY
jgi:hypothetical protein